MHARRAMRSDTSSFNHVTSSFNHVTVERMQELLPNKGCPRLLYKSQVLLRYTYVLYCTLAQEQQYFTSSHVILTAYCINTAVFCISSRGNGVPTFDFGSVGRCH